MEWRQNDGVRWLEASLGDGARAAFSTRLGGVSEAPFDRLNLGLLTEDTWADVLDNRGRLVAALGLRSDRIAFARQVHGAEIESHVAGLPLRSRFGSSPGQETQRGGEGEAVSEADGQIVSEPGLAGLVFVADCLPIALRGPAGIAVLHCGWRPLAAGIIAKGAASVGATVAAIGPGIGPCCYEVGPEVLEAFDALGGVVVAGCMLDLAEVARRQLAAAGVAEIACADLCTSCNPELFFSHRRDRGRTGRQAGLAWLDGAPQPAV